MYKAPVFFQPDTCKLSKSLVFQIDFAYRPIGALVQGYFEFSAIRDGKNYRKMDIKPEICTGTGKITIPVTTNDFCFTAGLNNV